MFQPFKSLKSTISNYRLLHSLNNSENPPVIFENPSMQAQMSLTMPMTKAPNSRLKQQQNFLIFIFLLFFCECFFSASSTSRTILLYWAVCLDFTIDRDFPAFPVLLKTFFASRCGDEILMHLLDFLLLYLKIHR